MPDQSDLNVQVRFMGLSVNGTKFLMYAKTQGVCFTRTATIGRQELHLSAEALRKNLSDFGHSPTESKINDLLSKAGGFAEPFLAMLGANEICSFDASEFEGASNLHDFNFPIDDNFKNRFTVVIDGGTLEHIFNFPVAIKNCMEMVEVGGHFLALTPTNNFTGHGLYQFSPELFFRIFSEPNGFKLVRMIIFEDRAGAEWFEVIDPDAIKERVGLVNAQPTNLLVLAEKVETVEIFATPPQQSDYVALWKSNDTRMAATTTPAPPLLKVQHTGRGLFSKAAHQLYSFAPSPVKSLYRRVRYPQRRDPFSNSRFFRRMQIP
ncbi:MAG TPA: hypothetical protein VJ842_06025 [Pyrinomonadaceae bacterium]|nr:hypothetical protein [Pyrinomonadaceae bacterium]